MEHILNDNIFCKACEIYEIIENEVDTFKYMEIDDQIEGIIYYVNTYAKDIITDEPIDEIFINHLYKNCHNAYMNTNYPYMQGDSEMSYIEELREAQTFSMIKSVIKDLYEYYEK